MQVNNAALASNSNNSASSDKKSGGGSGGLTAASMNKASESGGSSSSTSASASSSSTKKLHNNDRLSAWAKNLSSRLEKGAFANSIASDHDHDHVNADDFASNINKGTKEFIYTGKNKDWGKSRFMY